MGGRAFRVKDYFFHKWNNYKSALFRFDFLSLTGTIRIITRALCFPLQRPAIYSRINQKFQLLILKLKGTFKGRC